MLNIQDLIAKHDKKIEDLKNKALALKNVKEIDQYDYINEMDRINTLTKQLDEALFVIGQRDYDASGLTGDNAITIDMMKEHIINLTTIITNNGIATKTLTDKNYDDLIKNDLMDETLDKLRDLTSSSLVARNYRAKFLMVVPLGEASKQLEEVQNLSADPQTEILTWDSVENATEYIIRMAHVGTDTKKKTTTVDTTLNLTEFIKTGTTWKISVIASAPENSDVFNSKPVEITYTAP